MKAEETLQVMADFYPSLFPTRKHALNYLFCVVGNGYKWINGELVSNNEYLKRYKIIQEISNAEFKNEYMWIEQNKFYREIYEEDPTKIPIEYIFEWCPLSKEYSKLYNYPKDIKSDWLSLINECKQLLINDNIKI